MIKLCAWEWKKMVVKGDGWVLLCGLAVWCLLDVLAGFHMAAYIETPTVEKQLAGYYREYGGTLTGEKLDRIECHNEAIAQAKKMQNQAFSDYDNQRISPEELESILSQTDDWVNQEMAFRLFYRDVSYCREDPQHRFLVEKRGWQMLLKSTGPHFLLVLICVLLVSRMCSCDLSQTTEAVLKTADKGRQHILFAKWGTAAGIAVFIGVFYSLCLYGKVMRYLPLDGYSAPIQSLPAFSASVYPFSLLGMFLVGCAVRVCGLVLLSVGSVCLILLVRQAAAGTLLALSVNMIPYFLWVADEAYTRIPVPIGLVTAFSYFAGDSGRQGLVPITPQEFMVLLLGTAGVTGALCWLSYVVYTKGTLKRRRPREQVR